jgi:hypothetical protein
MMEKRKGKAERVRERPTRDSRRPAEATPQQSQRDKFIQTARELECDETGDVLDEALRTIGRARKRWAAPPAL